MKAGAIHNHYGTKSLTSFPSVANIKSRDRVGEVEEEAEKVGEEVEEIAPYPQD